VFKNLEKIQPHDMAQAAAALAAHGLSKKRLRECIKNLAKGKVMVVGDLLIDELLEGKPERISREAPVLILEHMETELIPGGAANTAHNITALGASCHAVGVCGKDEYAAKLAALLEKYSITHSLVQDPSRPTTVKTRILSRSYAIRQQLLRLDRISHATIDSVVQSLLSERIERAASGYNAIILSDYRAGVISDGVIATSRKVAAQQGLLYVIDAQEGFERFQAATLLTPNQPDAETAVGYAFDTPEKLLKGGEDLLVLTGAQAILITRGPEGMVLFRTGHSPVHMPVFNRSEVFDVTGAGDTVVATMTLALSTGSTPEEAMALGNLAAGIVVRKPGTAVTTQEELIENLEQVALSE
jgi:rfaE bifunctional protein kinase chain/domain